MSTFGPQTEIDRAILQVGYVPMPEMKEGRKLKQPTVWRKQSRSAFPLKTQAAHFC
jgi:predicted DNA-binding transcriptional regulator AlpA